MTEPAAKMADVEPPESADRTRGLLAAIAACAAGVALMATSVDTPLPFLGWYLLSSVAVALLVLVYRPGRRGLLVALAVAALLVGLGFVARQRDGVDPFQRDHDGGVVATEAAARMARDLENPYTADFTEALSPHHDTLEALDAGSIPNPLVEHYPYLPAAFLVHAPLTLLGSLYDPRILYVAVSAGALACVALRGPAGPTGRTAAVLATVASGAVAAYLPWGANDTAAASLVVLAAFLVPRRAIVAGILLGLAVSMKVLLVVAALPLGVLWWVTHRREGTRAMAAAAALLAATCLPYLVASPTAFIDDTVRFNLGTTDLTYPTSGIGLGALRPDTFDGPLLIATSAALVLGAAAIVVWWVRRAPQVEVALFGAGWIVFAGLLPARTFQLSYAALFVVLWGAIWRLPRTAWWPGTSRAPSA